MTNYVVLRKIGEYDWTEFTAQYASSARRAVRQALDGGEVTEGVFVALPARSWKPVTVETKTALKFGKFG